MSAFRRRTMFAAPLIISLATGCSKKADPPERITHNPPDPGTSFSNQWDVRRVAPGKCEALDVMACDPGVKCNPPPPRAVECPPGTSGKTVIRVAELTDKTCGIVPQGCSYGACVKIRTACPLPDGQQLPERLVEVWIVEKDKSGDGCHAEEPVECPPGKDCNPPSPRKIECPPGVTATATRKVGLLPDQTCAILPDGCKAPACATPQTPCPKN